jgi:uncharacterized membrane protein
MHLPFLKGTGTLKAHPLARILLPRGVWHFLLIALTISGIVFRFADLDREIFWHDEAYTALRISGYTETELIQNLFINEPLDRDDLLIYQQLTPEKTLSDTLNSLAREDAQHPPLYYILTRWWAQLFGDSIASLRTVSALLSLMALPAMYWLCYELFNSEFAGLIGMALISVSPFHILYAREAREYGLWTATILLASAVFLKAIAGKQNIKKWVIYTVTLAASFYSFLFSALVAIAHGSYLLAIDGFKITQKKMSYFFASWGAVLLFIPWIVIVFNQFSKVRGTTAWTAQPMAPIGLAIAWVANSSRVFFDLNLDSDSPLIYSIPALVFAIALIGYSLYFLIKYTQKKVWLFVILLIALPALTLILPDLILGGRRSTVSRYLIPSYLGIELAVTALLSLKLATAKSMFQQRLWQGIALTVLLAGMISGGAIAHSETWWNKKNSHNHPQAARLINAAEHPLLITSDFRFNRGEMLSLAHLLDRHVTIQLVLEGEVPNLGDEREGKDSKSFSDIYLFNPSKRLQEGLQKRYPDTEIEPVKPEALRLEKLTGIGSGRSS